MSEETFGRYTLSRQMAVGGMAEIWLARQRGPGGFEKVLVLKRILPHLAQDEAFVHMFLDEARLAAQLSHPHIAAVTDFGEESGVYYLAMELVRGPDLRRLVRTCAQQQISVPPPVAARIVSQVCAALDYAHKARDSQGQPLHVIHRDVSPQNILVTLDGDAKLVDFGIARAMSQSAHTQSGMVKGKFNYMAPEQLSGEAIDARTDLFAAGLVLYELLTGRQAYEGEGQSVIARVLDARIRPAHELRGDLPAPLSAILQRALQKEPAQRHPSAAAMESELEQFLVSQGAPVTSRAVASFLASVPVPGADPLAEPLSPAASGAEPTALQSSAPKKKAVESGSRKAAPQPAEAPPHDTAPEQPASPEAPAPEGADVSTRLTPSQPRDPQAALETVVTPSQKRAAVRRAGASSGPSPTVEVAVTAATSAADTLREDDDLALGLKMKRSPLPYVLGAGALLAAAVAAFALLPSEPGPAVATPLAPAQPPAAKVPPHSAEREIAAPVEPAAADAAAPSLAAEPAGPDAAVAGAAVAPTPSKPEPARPAPVKAPKPVAVAKADQPGKTPPIPPPPPPPPAATAEPGTLSLLAQPWVYVRVDGQDAGQTPLLKKALPAGTHRVLLANPELGLKKELSVEIQAGQEHKEVVKFGKAKLTFVAVPWAEVRLDGKLLGQTPMPPQEVYEGLRSLRASNPDTGKKIDRELVVEAGKDQTVKLDLR